MDEIKKYFVKGKCFLMDEVSGLEDQPVDYYFDFNQVTAFYPSEVNDKEGFTISFNNGDNVFVFSLEKEQNFGVKTDDYANN